MTALEDPSSWGYRALGPGQVVTLWNGANIEIDALFAGVFDLERESVLTDE